MGHHENITTVPHYHLDNTNHSNNIDQFTIVKHLVIHTDD